MKAMKVYTGSFYGSNLLVDETGGEEWRLFPTSIISKVVIFRNTILVVQIWTEIYTMINPIT